MSHPVGRSACEIMPSLAYLGVHFMGGRSVCVRVCVGHAWAGSRDRPPRILDPGCTGLCRRCLALLQGHHPPQCPGLGLWAGVTRHRPRFRRGRVEAAAAAAVVAPAGDSSGGRFPSGYRSLGAGGASRSPGWGMPGPGCPRGPAASLGNPTRRGDTVARQRFSMGRECAAQGSLRIRF